MLTENMLRAWNVVFVCNTESIFLCVSTSEAEPPLAPLTLTTALVDTYPQKKIIISTGHLIPIS